MIRRQRIDPSRHRSEGLLLPDCSIVIPAYNADRYLKEAVDSALRTEGISVEVIIVDDGSVDSTSSVARSLTKLHENVRYIRQENAGVSAARNAGFQKITSECVCFLDADDSFSPGGLERMFRAIHRHPDASAAYGHVLYFDEQSRPLQHLTARSNSDQPRIATTERILQGNITDTPGAVLFRVAKLRLAGSFDETIRIGEDWELYTRASQFGDFVYCGPEPVLNYRIHQSSAMHNSAKGMKDYEPALSKVFRATEHKGIDAKSLDLFRMRKVAGIFRYLIIRERQPGLLLSHLRMLLCLCISSSFDKVIVATTLRSIARTGKNMILGILGRNRR